MGERLNRAQQRVRTRQRLLDAAETLFAQHGIHQTSLDEVATAAGLTKGAIYANFDGKNGLLAAILERRNSEDHVANAGPDVDPAAAVSEWLRHIGDSYQANLAVPEMQRFAMAFVEFWLYAMRTPTARDTVAQWLRAARDSNAKEIIARSGGDPPIPAGRFAALMLALDIGLVLQHLIDPDAVAADTFAAGLTAITRPAGGGQRRPGGPGPTRSSRGRARPK